MTEESYKRKLTTIFSTDAVDYSRLMGDDEAATVRTIELYRKIISDLITQYRGRVIDSPGDNLLAEFTSIVDAVQCAVAIQKELQSRNAELAEERKMRFRIGINLGDVIEEGDRIYGDGVNIAARLESIADPGGICISKTAFDHIETKLPFGYEYIGEQEVKNIASPVDTYKVIMDPRVTTPPAAGVSTQAPQTSSRKIAMTFAVVVAIVIGAVVVWQYAVQKSPEPTETVDLGAVVFPVQGKPSIAVMPFENMTGDPEQKYFCDGMADQIISALSEGPYLYVTARTSSFAYRGKSMTAQQIASELDVRYLLEGSVQRNADQIRVNVQLIDGENGKHVLAERYDRKAEDLFALQDEIAMGVLASLNVEVTGFTSAELSNIRPKNLKAYEHYLKGHYYHLGRRTQDIDKARQEILKAIELDPEFAAAYKLLGYIYMDEITRRRTKTPDKVFEKAEQMARKAEELSPDYPPYTLWSHIYRVKKDSDKAIPFAEKGVQQDPNNAYRYFFLNLAQHLGEQFEKANATIETALQLAPHRPVNYLFQYAWSFVGMEQYDQAIPVFNEIIERGPKSFFAYLSYKGLAASYELSGNHEKASWAASNVMRMNPKYSLAIDKKLSPAKEGAFKEKMFDAYQRAGLK